MTEVITVVSNDSPDSQLRSRRIPYRQRVLIAPKDGSERHYGESFDLSLGGMFITTILPLEVGEIADIEIPLDSLRFTAGVKVVWVRGKQESEDDPVGMAVEFVGLNPNQKKLIHRQISNHTQAGGQLKVGSPATIDQRAATTVSSARRPTGSRSAPTRKRAFESPGRWWLIAAAAAVVVAVLLLTLLL